MPMYQVEVPEVHTSLMVIEADNEEEAVMLLREGDGDEVECLFSYTLEDSQWIVTPITPDKPEIENDETLDNETEVC